MARGAAGMPAAHGQRMLKHVVVLSLLAACTEGARTLPSDRSFTQLVDGAATHEQCIANAPPGFNCLHRLELCANGGFMLVVTDIINEGSYEVSGSSVSAVMRSPGDGPETFELTLTTEGFTSAELAGQHPWLEREVFESDRERLATSCASLTGRHWWNE